MQKNKHKLPKDENPVKKKKRKVDETVKKISVRGIFSPSKHGNTSQMIEENATAIQSNCIDLNLEAWSSFSLQQPLLEALRDMEFIQPTQIQALTLPAAILGIFFLINILK